MAKRKKYVYFVSYSYTQTGTLKVGFSNTEYVTSKEISSIQDIEKIEDSIDLNAVSVLYYALLRIENKE